MPAKILVTGAAGFIGSHLSEFLLEQGHEVIGLDNFDPFYPREVKEQNLNNLKKEAGFQFFELDLRQGQTLADLPPFDTVVHLAAKAGVRPSIENPQAYIDNNIVATQNILQLCVERGVKKIAFASSSSIYGNSSHIPFVEAGHEYEPISPYAFTKRSCELMNYTYHYLYNVDIINLRFFTVYGPRQRPDLAIHKFVKLISQDRRIPMFGDGSTSRDYTFVADTVNGVIGALEYLWQHEGTFETVNLGNNQPVKLKDLINAVGHALGKKVEIEQLPMQEGDVNITYASIEKAGSLFGYKPSTSLAEGLAKFVTWHRNQLAISDS
jgi:nucleoside-diphosphate-sugar epimerase